MTKGKSKLTLVVALESKNGIVISGDTRGTIGDPRGLTAISDVHKKVFQLTKYCGIGVSGSSELGTALLDGIQKKLSDMNCEFIDKTIGETRSHVRTLYNDWFSQFPIDKRPAVLLTIAGYAEVESRRIPKIYLLNSQLDYAPMLFDKGICMIGIPQYATYLANRYYDRTMDKDNVAALAEFLISETASQDPKVGGPINIAIINPATGYSELSEKELAAIKKRNDKQRQDMKKFFAGV